MDLDAAAQARPGRHSTVEESLRIAASVAHDAIMENRAVGVTTSGHRLVSIPADRGPRQRMKIMQLLAAVEGDGRTPLAEVLLSGSAEASPGHDGGRGHAVASTADWVRALIGLRSRGVAAVVIPLDAASYELAMRPRHRAA